MPAPERLVRSPAPAHQGGEFTPQGGLSELVSEAPEEFPCRVAVARLKPAQEFGEGIPHWRRPPHASRGRKSGTLAALARFFADSAGDADFFIGGTATGGEPADTGSFVGHTES
jgi:hypothetical protein